jgi:hypothetical protein
MNNFTKRYDLYLKIVQVIIVHRSNRFVGDGGGGVFNLKTKLNLREFRVVNISFQIESQQHQSCLCHQSLIVSESSSITYES